MCECVGVEEAQSALLLSTIVNCFLTKGFNWTATQISSYEMSLLLHFKVAK